MKRLCIFFLLISFLSSARAYDEQEKHGLLKETYDSLAQKVKRSGEHSNDFALSKGTGNLLLFALSLGFLLYLPRHLSKQFGSRGSDHNLVDSVIAWPHQKLFNSNAWKYFYYEIMTLLAGYVCAKTGKPYWEKIKGS